MKFNSKLMHKPVYPFFERIFYRPVASVITVRVAAAGITPTAMNFIGFFVGLGGIALIGFGNYPQRIIGSVVLIFSYILDCVDGQLARGLKNANGFGALLDTSLDSIKESLIFFALAWSYYSSVGDKYIFLYLGTILFLQRMFGRTLPWYRMLFKEDIDQIKKDALGRVGKVLKPLAIVFSESYRSGTIWLIIFLGVLSGQTIPTFIYFILVLTSLFIFLIGNAYLLTKHA